MPLKVDMNQSHYGGTLINAGVKGYGYYFCHNSVFTKAILALKGGK